MKYLLLISIIFNALSASNKIYPNEPTKSIEIIIPANGSSIECAKTKAGKKACFTVKGNSVNIREGEYITLFLKPKNGDKWLNISKSSRVEQSYLGSWALNIDVEVSKKCKEAELLAIVSKMEIKENEIDAENIDSDKNFVCRSQKDFIIKAQ